MLGVAMLVKNEMGRRDLERTIRVMRELTDFINRDTEGMIREAQWNHERMEPVWLDLEGDNDRANSQ